MFKFIFFPSHIQQFTSTDKSIYIITEGKYGDVDAIKNAGRVTDDGTQHVT